MVAIFFVHDVCWRGWRWPCSRMCCSGGGHVLTIFQPMGGELTTPKQHRKSDEKERRDYKRVAHEAALRATWLAAK